MKLIISASYLEMSEKAAEDLTDLIKKINQPLVCVASGDSPAGLYKVLSEKVGSNELDVSLWSFLSLDEWTGMNGNDEGSCRYHLNNQLFNPLEIKAEKICFFNGRADNLQLQCEQVEKFIEANGGIDVAIVGLGLNGHVGMNEPGTPANVRTHVADIDPITQESGQKYFKEQQKLTHGLTLGLANLMEARNIILIVNGRHKAEIVKRVLQGEISELLPASLLRNHPNLSIYLDKEAAALIESD